MRCLLHYAGAVTSVILAIMLTVPERHLLPKHPRQTTAAAFARKYPTNSITIANLHVLRCNSTMTRMRKPSTLIAAAMVISGSSHGIPCAIGKKLRDKAKIPSIKIEACYFFSCRNVLADMQAHVSQGVQTGVVLCWTTVHTRADSFKTYRQPGIGTYRFTKRDPSARRASLQCVAPNCITAATVSR